MVISQCVWLCFGVIGAIFAVQAVPIQRDVTPFQELYIEQVVDHFNYVSFPNKTYKQRYLVNDQWWMPGKGPIFFYTGNEGNIEAFWANSGFVFDIAPLFRALVVFAEHRYYGKSLPFGNDSFKPPYVGLLTIEQAMADFAVLIHHLRNASNSPSTPVILFGGSYGGVLSTYMKFKYPNLVDGAIAASAPIFQTVGLVPGEIFFQAVTKAFRDVNPACEQIVRDAFVQLDKWAAAPRRGYGLISTTFKLCKPIQRPEEYSHLLFWIRFAFVNAAMMNYPYPADFMGHYPANPVKVTCEGMLAAPSPAQALFNATALMYNSTGDVLCFKPEEEYIECADPTGCGTGTDGIAWDFQACAQMHMEGGSTSVTDMFPALPFTVDMKREYCWKKWSLVPDDIFMSVEMWGKDINHTKNIIYSNGDLDPWTPGGVLYNVSDTVLSAIVHGGAHHLDLRSHHPEDPPSVVEVRSFEMRNIQKWVTEAWQRRSNMLWHSGTC